MTVHRILDDSSSQPSELSQESSLPVNCSGSTDSGCNTMQYKANEDGVHLVSVQYKGNHIHGSPFRAVQKLSPDASACKVSATWLTDEASGKAPATVLSGDPIELEVDVENAGVGELTANAVYASDNSSVQVVVSAADQRKRHKVLLPAASKPGSYSINIEWSGKPIPKSPVGVDVVERLVASDIVVSESDHLTHCAYIFCKK